MRKKFIIAGVALGIVAALSLAVREDQTGPFISRRDADVILARPGCYESNGVIFSTVGSRTLELWRVRQ